MEIIHEVDVVIVVSLYDPRRDDGFRDHRSQVIKDNGDDKDATSVVIACNDDDDDECT